MRLRPSGRSGPVATQIRAFQSYQESEAWTWEHMALTRARVVSATPGFGEEVEEVIREVLRRRRDPRTIAHDVFEMRQAIAREKGEANRWDVKYAAGGLIDVEFMAQILQLLHAADHPNILDTSTGRVLEKTARARLLPAEDADVVRAAARLYHDLGQILRLCLPEKFEPEKAGPGSQALLARAGDVPDFPTLDASLAEMQARVRKSFVRIVGEK
jgi:[glutamine synthetase] adenylyltransferase / [glutamine synthetase]-adenylyl-L-tyrosine phosphorylase